MERRNYFMDNGNYFVGNNTYFIDMIMVFIALLIIKFYNLMWRALNYIFGFESGDVDETTLGDFLLLMIMFILVIILISWWMIPLRKMLSIKFKE